MHTFAAIFLLLVSSTTFSMLECDPEDITSQKGRWYLEDSEDDKNEDYVDYYLQNKLIFRVLERFVPSVNIMIASAEKTGKRLAVYIAVGDNEVNSRKVNFIKAEKDVNNMFAISQADNKEAIKAQQKLAKKALEREAAVESTSFKQLDPSEITFSKSRKLFAKTPHYKVKFFPIILLPLIKPLTNN